MTTDMEDLIRPVAPDQALRMAVESAWSIDTTFTPDIWTPRNPARGQCGVTSVYLWTSFQRSQLHHGKTLSGERHFWCVIDGEHVDWTIQQFEEGTPIVDLGPCMVGDILANWWMQERFENLRARIAGESK